MLPVSCTFIKDVCFNDWSAAATNAPMLHEIQDCKHEMSDSDVRIRPWRLHAATSNSIDRILKTKPPFEM
jgi:hypothetical protein